MALIGPPYALSRIPPVAEGHPWTDDEVAEALRAAGVDRPSRASGSEAGPASGAVAGDRGAWVVRRFLVLCEHPRTRARMLAAVRAGAGNAVAGRLLVGTVGRLVAASLGRSRRVDAVAVRAELVAAQLAGVAVLRYVTCVEPVASMPVDELVAWLAPAVAATLEGPAGR